MPGTRGQHRESPGLRAEGCRYPMEGSGSRGGTSNEQGLGFWGAKRTAFSAKPDENR